jgi:hypothetical protein
VRRRFDQKDRKPVSNATVHPEEKLTDQEKGRKSDFISQFAAQIVIDSGDLGGEAWWN